MNIKAIALGSIAFFITYFAVGFLTGWWIHEQILQTIYAANGTVWQPALAQQGINHINLMPSVLAFMLITSILLTLLFDSLREAMRGSVVVKGIKFGLMVWLIASLVMLAWSAVFNLPGKLWVWWSIDLLIKFVTASAVMAWAVGRFNR